MKKRQSARLGFVAHQTVVKHVDTLVATGLYGRTRSEVVKRLVCEGIVRVVGNPTFRLKGEA